MNPNLVSDTLLVVAPFKDATGFQYVPGDRALLNHRSVRRAALASPHLFRMEYETADVDLDFIRELDQRYEAEFEEAKRARAAAKVQRERNLRQELEDQDKQDPVLERRFKRQEKEDKERRKAEREETERRLLEEEIAHNKDRALSGYHF